MINRLRPHAPINMTLQISVNNFPQSMCTKIGEILSTICFLMYTFLVFVAPHFGLGSKCFGTRYPPRFVMIGQMFKESWPIYWKAVLYTKIDGHVFGMIFPISKRFLYLSTVRLWTRFGVDTVKIQTRCHIRFSHLCKLAKKNYHDRLCRSKKHTLNRLLPPRF